MPQVDDPGIQTRKVKDLSIQKKKNLHTSIPSSMIPKSKTVETYVYQHINEKTICGMLNGILFDCKKEMTYNTGHMDKPCKHAK